MDYGKSFKRYRIKSNLTQKEAASLIGVKDYQLGNYETNRSEPTLDTLKRMSKAYGVSIDKMLGNNVLKNSSAQETVGTEAFDLDELLEDLNDVVEKINKSSKQ